MIPIGRDHQRLHRLMHDGCKDIIHLKFPDEYRTHPGAGNVHIAVVVDEDGFCYAYRVRRSKSHYNRKIAYHMAVGGALKKAVTHPGDPEFAVDLELDGKDLYLAVKTRLQDLGWL